MLAAFSATGTVAGSHGGVVGAVVVVNVVRDSDVALAVSGAVGDSLLAVTVTVDGAAAAEPAPSCAAVASSPPAEHPARTRAAEKTIPVARRTGVPGRSRR
ncbi:hypothetical protein NCCP2495_06750 [Dietzia sp. NCCP-2495]|nr:hypothetical protein NCCP2495_06750 [Dietzia sp. NCCP-2495]